MSGGARLGLIAAAIAVAVLAFVIARPGDDDDNGSGGQSAETTTQAQPGGSRTPANGRPRPKPGPRVETIRVRRGEPVGGVRELKVDKGDEVRFAVTADESEEVHVHGYDLFEAVRPGKPASLRFDADIEGIFEVELEGSHTPIAELRVEP
jgi:hypothetical protein